MPSHILTFRYTRSGEQISENVTVTADGEINVDFTLTSSQTDKQVLLALDVSALKSFCVFSDANLTIETNSATEADDTITVVADNPYMWHSTSGVANPFTSATDVTSIYVTNGTAAAATVYIRALQDSTP